MGAWEGLGVREFKAGDFKAVGLSECLTHPDGVEAFHADPSLIRESEDFRV